MHRAAAHLYPLRVSHSGVLGRHGGRKGLGRNREEERQWTTLPDDAARGRRCLGRRSRLLDLIDSRAACRPGSGVLAGLRAEAAHHSKPAPDSVSANAPAEALQLINLCHGLSLHV